MVGFERRRDASNMFNNSILGVQGELDVAQVDRLTKIKRNWNFYEGYHWEDLPEQDTPEITVNYCRAFVDKYVAFELGKSFSISLNPVLNDVKTATDGLRTTFEFLEDVWIDNKQYQFSTEMGQMKSITGDAWIQVRFDDAEDIDDPYNIYEDGRIRIILMNTSVMFPEYDPHDKDKLIKLTIMYMYEKIEKTPILNRTTKKQVLYKQVWTNEECVIIDDGVTGEPFLNKYKCIPFVQIKNLTIAGRNEGRSDLDDIIPLNTEYNLKQSDISEIIDYHSAPITVVYGAKIGNLEKGANKMWGGLAKDARIENLEMKGDLGASGAYTNTLKLSMCEVGGIPETVLGGAQAISNTSGVALQYINLPLIEKTRIKKTNTEDGLERLNKLILLVGVSEGLIAKPKDVPTRDFYFSEVTLADTLPKDTLLELQQLQQEISMSIESRRGAMKRMGKENIESIISEVDTDKKANPDVYGLSNNLNKEGEPSKINSGMTNGNTPVEEVRKEMTGTNGAIK